MLSFHLYGQGRPTLEATVGKDYYSLQNQEEPLELKKRQQNIRVEKHQGLPVTATCIFSRTELLQI